jgi:hypothetical protein
VSSKSQVLEGVKHCIQEKLNAKTLESKQYWQDLKESVVDIDGE